MARPPLTACGGEGVDLAARAGLDVEPDKLRLFGFLIGVKGGEQFVCGDNEGGEAAALLVAPDVVGFRRGLASSP